MNNELVIPDLFKAGDFDYKGNPGTVSREYAAGCANARFKEIAKEWKPVYHTGISGDIGWCESMVLHALNNYDKRTALLAFPQDIFKKECLHQIIKYPIPLIGHPVLEAECAKCGAKLKAKWEECK
jgi:hypothetical protein